MRAVADGPALSRALALAGRAARGGVLGVHSLVRVRVAEDVVLLGAGDGLSRLELVVPARETSPKLSGLLVDPANLVAAIGKKVAKDVELARASSDAGSPVLLARAGRTRARLPATFEGDFPDPEPSDPDAWRNVDPADLISALEGVAHAVCADVHRPGLCGTRLEVEGWTLRCVATDGHRLAASERVLSEAGAELAATFDAALARALLKTRPGTCRVGLDGARLVVECAWDGGGVARLSVPLVAEQFPPWRRVVPSHGEACRADRDALLAALRRAELRGKRGSSVTAFSTIVRVAGGALEVETNDPTTGRVTEDVPLESVADGADGRSCCASARYLIDAAGSLPRGPVVLEIGPAPRDSMDPPLMRTPDGSDQRVVVQVRA